MADFQFFHDFIFMNGCPKSSAVQINMGGLFIRGVKFHKWATSTKFVEFTHTSKEPTIRYNVYPKQLEYTNKIYDQINCYFKAKPTGVEVCIACVC